MKRIRLQIGITLAIIVIAAVAVFAAEEMVYNDIKITGYGTGAIITNSKTKKVKTVLSGGRTYIRDTAGSIQAKANKVSVITKGLSSKDAIETADLTGQVWFFVRPDGKDGEWVEASANSAHLDRSKETADLSGNVTIKAYTPGVNEPGKPTLINTDKATLSLKKELGEDEPRVIMTGDPDKNSITFSVPVKPKEKK